MTEKIGKRLGEGAVGAGLVLVVVPSLALYFGIEKISANTIVGLPVLAIFGIMILFGTMSLTSTLFARLGLSDTREALALPTGSIRATIALSLIVLFAIIAIMLFQSLGKPYSIPGLSEEDKKSILSQPSNKVLAVLPSPCVAPSGAESATTPTAPASAPKACFEVHLVQSAGEEAVDIAKQLLILIGTLMTSVTSFYFASRGSAAPKPTSNKEEALRKTTEEAQPGHDHADEVDGCDVDIGAATPDEDLPAATGGVER